MKLFLLIVVLLSILGKSFADVATSYVGAVVEHEVYLGSGTEQADELLGVNLDIYESHVRLAKAKGAQVVVFPEFGLTAVQNNATRSDYYPFAIPIPSAEENVIPCGNENFKSSGILSRMSCAAKQNSIVTLINTIDWVDCSGSECPEDGHYQYNTNVLFDEKGQIVAKYHKSHEWPGLIGPYDQAPAPTEVTYLTSFGVNFGMFTCFDIMFPDPAKTLRSKGISHFLYPVKQGDIGLKTIISQWSSGQQATMLVSNLGAGPKDDCSAVLVNGTIIDSGKYYLAKYPKENVIVATVPI